MLFSGGIASRPPGPLGLVVDVYRAISEIRSAGRVASPPVRLWVAGQREAADRVLACDHREDLIDLLDEELPNLWSAEARSALQKIKTPSASDFERSELDMESLRRTLGETGSEMCAEGHQAMKSTMRSLAPLVALASVSDALLAPKGNSLSIEKIQAFFYDDRIPLSIRRDGLAFARSMSCMVVIARAEEKGARLDAWLGLALAEEFRSGLVTMRDFVDRTKASPLAWAGEIRTEVAKSSLQRSREASWSAQASESGLDVFYPYGEHGEPDA